MPLFLFGFTVITTLPLPKAPTTAKPRLVPDLRSLKTSQEVDEVREVWENLLIFKFFFAFRVLFWLMSLH